MSFKSLYCEIIIQCVIGIGNDTLINLLNYIFRIKVGNFSQTRIC